MMLMVTVFTLDDTAVGLRGPITSWWKKHIAGVNMVLTYWCDEAVHCPSVLCLTPSIWCSYALTQQLIHCFLPLIQGCLSPRPLKNINCAILW